MTQYRIVVVGGSWGGVRAAGVVLAGLPAAFGVPIVMVLHRSPASDEEAFVSALQRQTALRVTEGADKMAIAAGSVYVAPAGYHLLVEGEALALSTEEAVNHSRPSIDVLFESAAEEYENGAVAVVLTGANADGAKGLARIREAGGYAVVQDPAGAERPEMPRAAIATAGADRIVDLDGMAPLLLELCGAL